MDWNESFCFFLISLAIKHGLNPNCMQAYWTQIIDLKFSSNQYLRQTKHCTDEIHETFKCILHNIMMLISNRYLKVYLMHIKRHNQKIWKSYLNIVVHLSLRKIKLIYSISISLLNLWWCIIIRRYFLFVRFGENFYFKM